MGTRSSEDASGGSSIPPSHPPKSQQKKKAPTWSSKVRETGITKLDLQFEVKDKTISAVIPEEVLVDSQPLWKNFVLGHFIGDAPHIGTVHATVNRLWCASTKSPRIDVQFLNDSAVLFRIDDDIMRSKVIKRYFWHIGETPLVVQEWRPDAEDQKPKLTAIPIWVDFANVPGDLYSFKGLSFLGSLIGNPIKLHPRTEKCLRLDVARVLIEVNLMHSLPNQIKIPAPNGDNSIISVSYPWLPPRCESCNKWGHSQKNCVEPKYILQRVSPDKIQSSEIPNCPLQPENVLTPLPICKPVIQANETSSLVINPTLIANTTSPVNVIASVLPDQENNLEYSMNIMLPKEKTSGAELEEIWTTVTKAARRAHVSPNTSLSPTNRGKGSPERSKSNSPLGYRVLADIREEGEIEEEESEDDIPLATIVDAEIASKVLSHKGRSRVPRRPIIKKKDLILSKQPASTKKASSRKP